MGPLLTSFDDVSNGCRRLLPQMAPDHGGVDSEREEQRGVAHSTRSVAGNLREAALGKARRGGDESKHGGSRRSRRRRPRRGRLRGSQDSMFRQDGEGGEAVTPVAVDLDRRPCSGGARRRRFRPRAEGERGEGRVLRVILQGNP